MKIEGWFRSPQVRRPLALASVVLAAGGLVLQRASTSAFAHDVGNGSGGSSIAAPLGPNAVTFAGPGLHGSVAISHRYVVRGEPTRMYAEVRLAADALDDDVKVRAPISLAVVLDTSGSMSGDKIEDAKRAVLRLLADMRDDDQIAVVRYSTTSEVLQPLARVGSVRAELRSRIASLEASGGTNIPSGLDRGLNALSLADRGRVKRVVLVSDGLDGSRAQAEELARSGFSSGVTISSLGIGADFDESYMGAVATSGHGNFAFVQDSGALAKFLTRELEETSKTTVENAVARVTLPEGARFVSASGADASVSGDTLVLSFGAIFAGDERRAIVELESDGRRDVSGVLAATASYHLVSCKSGASCGDASTSSASIAVASTDDRALVERSRDGAVLASATSVLASRRQIEAAAAYAHGDVARAQRLVEENEAAIQGVLPFAPAAVATSLGAQLEGYRSTKKDFANVRPEAAEGRGVAKSAAAKEMSNLSRKTW